MNSTNLGATLTENQLAQSIISAKPLKQRKIKHSRCMSKNSGRGSRGTSQHKGKQRKDKSLTFELSQFMQSTHTAHPSRANNIAPSGSQSRSKGAIRAQQVIPTSTQAANRHNSQASGFISPKGKQGRNKVVPSQPLLKGKDRNYPVYAFNLNQ